MTNSPHQRGGCVFLVLNNRMWRSGTLAIWTPSWMWSRRTAECPSKVSTRPIFTLACGRPPSPGTRRTWISTASTICTLESPNPGKWGQARTRTRTHSVYVVSLARQVDFRCAKMKVAGFVKMCLNLPRLLWMWMDLAKARWIWTSVKTICVNFAVVLVNSWALPRWPFWAQKLISACFV